MVHVGYYDKSIGEGLYETHLNYFVAAESAKQAKNKAHQLTEFQERSMHIDGMKENEKVIKDYTLRIKQAPSKLKSLDIQYKDQNRTKFKLELKLKESTRSLEMLKKRSEMFDSSMM